MTPTPVDLLASWLLQAALVWCPPAAHAYTGATDAQTRERYAAIVHDLAEVASAEDESPLFKGQTGRAQTALLALSIVSFESGGLRADVDSAKPSGDCAKSGSSTKCQATCLAQIWLRAGERIGSRQDCFRLEFARMRESFASCPGAPLDDKLAVYASGSCDVGLVQSEHRVRRALKYWDGHRFMPGVDP